MTNYLLPIFLIFFIKSNCIAQTKDSSTTKQWYIETGYQNYRISDKNRSPLIYVSNNGILDLRYQKINKQTIKSIGASFSLGNNQPKRFGQRKIIEYSLYSINGTRDTMVNKINPDISFLQINLYYSCLWKINVVNHDAFVGGKFQDFFYYGGIGGDIWFFSQTSLLPCFQLCLFTRKKYQLNTEISIPVISYLVRQPYSTDPSLPEKSYFKSYLKTGSAITTINKFQQIQFTCNFGYKLIKERQIGVSYQFMWMNYSNIPKRNLKTYSNSVLIYYMF